MWEDTKTDQTRGSPGLARATGLQADSRFVENVMQKARRMNEPVPALLESSHGDLRALVEMTAAGRSVVRLAVSGLAPGPEQPRKTFRSEVARRACRPGVSSDFDFRLTD